MDPPAAVVLLILLHRCVHVLLLPAMKCIRALFSGCFFREVAVGVGASVERDQPAPAQTTPQQTRFGSQTERLLFFLGKPRTKGSHFALARLIVIYGYYIAGHCCMPGQQ